MKRTPLRKASKSRAKELVIYRSLKAQILRNHPYCECPSRTGAPTCMAQATQLHHVLGRAQGMLCDERYIIPICQDCHAWIHAHAREARAMGILK